MQQAWLQLLRDGALFAGAPLLATAFLVVVLAPVARRLGQVDHPGNERKVHSKPTPYVGGAAITLGALVCAAFLLQMTRDVQALGVASLWLLVVGTFDDRFDISWRIRIPAQIGAAMILFYWGGVRVESIGDALGFPNHTLGVLSLPFTVLATVGITNAINWADGVDGLAPTLCLAAFGMQIAAAIYAGNAELVSDLVLMAGCVMGFLAFNLRTPWRARATAFLGGGAEILGLWIAWASFRLTQWPGHPVTPVLAPFLIAPPVIDCLVLIVRRVRAGHSPFFADRTHLHHRLLDAGLSVTAIVVGLTGLSLAIGFLAAAARLAHVPQPVFPVVYLAATVGYFLVTRRLGDGTSPARAPARSGVRIDTGRMEPVAEPALVPVRIEPTEG